MNRKDERDYIGDIRNRILRIETFLMGMTDEDYYRSLLHQDAVAHNFTIIGEAASRLSPATRSKYAQVPWREIIGFRNVIVHDYDGVEIREVWKTFKNDLPVLKAVVELMLAAPPTV